MQSTNVAALFLDIGGVMLTNGWDRGSRRAACETFGMDYEEVNERHHLTFPVYEEGKISLDEYLDRTIFYEPRGFTREAFKDFMYAQSEPHPEMIELVRTLKGRYGLKIATVSNEGRELTEYRIRKFHLGDFVDLFVSSCFVHCRKPDHDIYRFAIDQTQVSPDQAVYIDDRPMFADVARSLGLICLWHRGYEQTHARLEELGLK